MGLDVQNLTLLHRNDKSRDQPLHRSRLVSTLVIYYLESIKLTYKCQISIFLLVSVAE